MLFQISARVNVEAIAWVLTDWTQAILLQSGLAFAEVGCTTAVSGIKVIFEVFLVTYALFQLDKILEQPFNPLVTVSEALSRSVFRQRH